MILKGRPPTEMNKRTDKDISDIITGKKETNHSIF